MSGGVYDCSVATYNVLAQGLMRRTMFPYATKAALKWASRSKLLQQEVTRVSPAILCLQEVDSAYLDFWLKALTTLGYTCHFATKRATDPVHGLLLAYKRDVFRLVSYHVLHMEAMQCFARDEGEAKEVDKVNIAQLALLLPIAPITEALTSTNTSAHNTQTTKNVGSSSIPLLAITNTHLNWRYDFTYTKLRQVHLLLTALSALLRAAPDVAAITPSQPTSPAQLAAGASTGAGMDTDVYTVDLSYSSLHPHSALPLSAVRDHHYSHRLHCPSSLTSTSTPIATSTSASARIFAIRTIPLCLGDFNSTHKTLAFSLFRARALISPLPVTAGASKGDEPKRRHAILRRKLFLAAEEEGRTNAHAVETAVGGGGANENGNGNRNGNGIDNHYETDKTASNADPEATNTNTTKSSKKTKKNTPPTTTPSSPTTLMAALTGIPAEDGSDGSVIQDYIHCALSWPNDIREALRAAITGNATTSISGSAATMAAVGTAVDAPAHLANAASAANITHTSSSRHTPDTLTAASIFTEPPASLSPASALLRPLTSLLLLAGCAHHAAAGSSDYCEDVLTCMPQPVYRWLLRWAGERIMKNKKARDEICATTTTTSPLYRENSVDDPATRSPPEVPEIEPLCGDRECDVEEPVALAGAEVDMVRDWVRGMECLREKLASSRKIGNVGNSPNPGEIENSDICAIVSRALGLSVDGIEGYTPLLNTPTTASASGSGSDVNGGSDNSGNAQEAVDGVSEEPVVRVQITVSPSVVPPDSAMSQSLSSSSSQTQGVLNESHVASEMQNPHNTELTTLSAAASVALTITPARHVTAVFHPVPLTAGHTASSALMCAATMRALLFGVRGKAFVSGDDDETTGKPATATGPPAATGKASDTKTGTSTSTNSSGAPDPDTSSQHTDMSALGSDGKYTYTIPEDLTLLLEPPLPLTQAALVNALPQSIVDALGVEARGNTPRCPASSCLSLSSSSSSALSGLAPDDPISLALAQAQHQRASAGPLAQGRALTATQHAEYLTTLRTCTSPVSAEAMAALHGCFPAPTSPYLKNMKQTLPLAPPTPTHLRVWAHAVTQRLCDVTTLTAHLRLLTPAIYYTHVDTAGGVGAKTRARADKHALACVAPAQGFASAVPREAGAVAPMQGVAESIVGPAAPLLAAFAPVPVLVSTHRHWPSLPSPHTPAPVPPPPSIAAAPTASVCDTPDTLCNTVAPAFDAVRRISQLLHRGCAHSVDTHLKIPHQCVTAGLVALHDGVVERVGKTTTALTSPSTSISLRNFTNTKTISLTPSMAPSVAPRVTSPIHPAPWMEESECNACACMDVHEGPVFTTVCQWSGTLDYVLFPPSLPPVLAPARAVPNMSDASASISSVQSTELASLQTLSSSPSSSSSSSSPLSLQPAAVSVVGLGSMPTLEEAHVEVGLPNSRQGSDHVSVSATLCIQY